MLSLWGWEVNPFPSLAHFARSHRALCIASLGLTPGPCIFAWSPAPRGPSNRGTKRISHQEKEDLCESIRLCPEEHKSRMAHMRRLPSSRLCLRSPGSEGGVGFTRYCPHVDIGVCRKLSVHCRGHAEQRRSAFIHHSDDICCQSEAPAYELVHGSLFARGEQKISISLRLRRH